MAARIRKHHQDEVRAKIQASQIVNRLTSYFNGEIELTSGQVQTAKILLDKSISNAPTVLAGDEDNPLQIVGRIERAIIDANTQD